MKLRTGKITDRIVSVILSACMISGSSILSLPNTVYARDAFEFGERENYCENHTFGIVGTMTGWGSEPDIPMTDPDGDGIYVGIYKDIAAGIYEFKVRADSSWNDSWCEYEADYDRTLNSQSNCRVTVDDTTDLIVMLDTNGDDEVLWPVTYYLSKITSLSLKDELGKDIVSGYSVNWYDAETGELVSDKKDLSANEGNYYAEIIFDEYLSFIYKQPDRIDVVYGTNNPVSVEYLEKVDIKGKIQCEEKLPADLKIEVTEMISGHSRNKTVIPDSEGNFSFSVSDVTTMIKIRADGYYTVIKYPVMGNCSESSLDMGEIELKPILNQKIAVSIYTSAPVAGDEKRYEKPYNSFDEITFSLYNETQNKAIYDFTVDYPYIILEKNVNSSDKVKVSTVSSFSGSGSASVGFDENGQAYSKISMKENGKIRLTNISCDGKAFVFVFDNEGKCVQRGIANGSDFTTISLANGNYTVVLMEKNVLYKNFSSLDKLSEFGLTSGRDYVMEKVSVQEGVIRIIDKMEVPSFVAENFNYTVTGNTNVSVNKTDVLIDEYVTVRVAYEIQDQYASSNQKVILDIPDDVLIEDMSMTVDGKLTSYFKDNDGNYVIRIGKKSGIIRFYAFASKTGNYKVNAALSFDTADGTLYQSLGTAAFYSSQMVINVPDTTASKSVIVLGRTAADSEVLVYDGKYLIGKTKANKAGNWSCQVELHNCYTYSYHNVYAVVNLNDGTAESRKCEVFYDPYSWEVSKVTMYNSGGSFVFDFQGPPPVYRYYYYANSSFTFTIEFVCEIPKNCDVWLNVYGNTDIIQLKAVYNETKDMWVTSKTFENGFLPVSVEVEVGNYRSAVNSDGTVSYEYPMSVGDIMEMSEGIANEIMEQEESVSDIECEILDEDYGIYSIEDEIAVIEQGYFYCSPEILDSFSMGLENEYITERKIENDKSMYVYIGNSGNFNISMLFVDYNMAQNLPDMFAYEWLEKVPDENCYVIQSTITILGIKKECIDDVRNLLISMNDVDNFENIPSEPNKTNTKTTSTASSKENDKESYWNNLSDYWREDKLYAASKLSLDIMKWVNLLFDFTDLIMNKDKLRKLAFTGTNDIASLLDPIINQERDLDGKMYGMYSYFDYDSPYFESATIVINEYDKLKNKFSTFDDVMTAISFTCNVLPLIIKKLPKKLDGSQNPNVPQEPDGEVISEIIKAAKLWELPSAISGFFTFLDRQGAYEILYLKMRDLYEKERKRKGEGNDDLENDNGTGIGNINGNGSGNGRGNGKKKYPYNHLNPLRLILTYDPSGYIYEAVPSNRVEDATVRIYYQSDEKTDVLWDAENYGQINPQITDSQGRYAWDVPKGNWIVKVEKDGYDSADSSKSENSVDGYLPVPPPQFDVNIGIVSQDKPVVERVNAYDDEILIKFSQYMQIDTVNLKNIKILRNSKAVSGKIEPVNAEYNYGNTEMFASEFRFVPDISLNDSVDIEIKNVKNYNNSAMTGTYQKNIAVEVKPQKIKVNDSEYIRYGDSKEIVVKVLPVKSGVNKTITVKSSCDEIARIEEQTLTVDNDGTAKMIVTGELPGTAVLTLSLDGTDLTAEINVDIGFEDVPDMIYGDTNGDGSVDIADALMISRYDAGLVTLDSTQLSVSDVNKDGSVDIADALMIARFDAGLITAF